MQEIWNDIAGALSLKSKCYWVFKDNFFFYKTVNRFKTIFVKNAEHILK